MKILAVIGSPRERGKTLPADQKYWAENGWSDPGATYYYKSPVSPLRIGLAKLISGAEQETTGVQGGTPQI